MREFLLTIAFAATICYLITPYIKTLALKAGAFIHVRSRDTHTKVTPRWGGIGMWISMSITFLVVSHLPLVAKSFGREATGIFLAGTFIMILGALDDLYDLDSILAYYQHI